MASVVLIGSQSMFKPSLPQAGYAASKGALLTAMYYLADELGAGQHPLQHGRAVVDVGADRRDVREGHGQAARASPRRRRSSDIVGEFPLRRMTEDGEVADVAAFFASDHAKAVTGQHLLVNAGEMMR